VESGAGKRIRRHHNRTSLLVVAALLCTAGVVVGIAEGEGQSPSKAAYPIQVVNAKWFDTTHTLYVEIYWDNPLSS